MSMTLLDTLLHPDQGSLVGFISRATVQVVNEDLFPRKSKEVDDQDPNCTTAKVGIKETDNQTSQME